MHKIFSSQGEHIHVTLSAESFMVMSFCPGKLVKVGKVNLKQLFNLGEVTVRMHDVLNNGLILIRIYRFIGLLRSPTTC